MAMIRATAITDNKTINNYLSLKGRVQLTSKMPQDSTKLLCNLQNWLYSWIKPPYTT